MQGTLQARKIEENETNQTILRNIILFQNLSSCRDIRRNLQTFLIGRKIDPKMSRRFPFRGQVGAISKKKRRNEKTKSKGNYTFFKSCIPTESLQLSLTPPQGQ